MTKIAFYHYLPTGGAVRDAGQLLFRLRDRFSWELHFPEGAAPLLPESGLPVRCHAFPGGRRISGAARLAAPLMLWRKATAYLTLCRYIAKSIEASEASTLLCFPSMIISSPPLLTMISMPSVFCCAEYPRYIYERNIHKTGSRLGDLLIRPLLAREERIDREAARSSTVLVSNSSYMAPRLEKVYGRTARVLRPGVDTDFFTPGDTSTTGHLLSVGAMSPFKGHHLVVEAVAQLPAASRPRLYIVADRGSYPYEEALAARAGSAGVDLVIERGTTDERLRELYRGATAVVCAQQAEPYGLVPLEAGACGTPAVAVRQGGFLENIEDGVTGSLVDSTPQAISEAIAEMLADTSGASLMGIRAMEFVRTHRSADSQADALTDILRGRT